MGDFTLNTHHAYLNNDIIIKCNGPVCIVDKVTGKVYHFTDELKTHLCAGQHLLATENQEEEVFIEDAIKLGGGYIKNAFVFDDNPWVFVTTKDRLYIANKETKEEYVDLTKMKFMNPKQGDEVFEKIFNDKKMAIEEKFKSAF